MSDSSALVHLSRRRIGIAIGVTALINLLLLAGTALSILAWRSGGEPGGQPSVVQFLLSQSHLGAENVFAAWWSSMLALLVAIAALIGFAADRGGSGTRGVSWSRFGWVALAAIFGLLSIDELGSIHERLGQLRGTLTGGPPTGWVTLLAAPIALVGLFLIAFAWARVRRHRGAALMMTLGVGLLLTVPVQEKLEVAALSGGGSLRLLSTLLEEGTELFGIWAFFAGCLLFARSAARQTATPGADAAIVDLRLPARPAMAALALTFAGLGLGLVLALATSEDRPADNRDALWTALYFDAAIRNQDADLAAAFAAERVVLKIVPPPAGETGVYVGRESLRNWVNQARTQGFRLTQQTHQPVGQTVTWRGLVDLDVWRAEGRGARPIVTRAQVDNGKVTAYTLDFAPVLGQAWGVAENWFPSALALVAALIGLQFWDAARRAGRARTAAFPALAAVGLLLSIYYGANLPAYENWGVFDIWRQLLREALSGAVVVTGLLLLFARPAIGGRWLVIAWVVLVGVALGLEKYYSPAVAFAGFALLAPALLGAFQRADRPVEVAATATPDDAPRVEVGPAGL